MDQEKNVEATVKEEIRDLSLEEKRGRD